jgi:hypothetical protein
MLPSAVSALTCVRAQLRDRRALFNSWRNTEYVVVSGAGLASEDVGMSGLFFGFARGHGLGK